MSKKMRKFPAVLLSFLCVFSCAFTAMADTAPGEEAAADFLITEAPTEIEVEEVREVTEQSGAKGENSTSNAALLAAGSEKPYVVLNGMGTLTFYYDVNRETREGTKKYDVSKTAVFQEWDSDSDLSASVKAVKFDKSFQNCTGLTKTTHWFDGMENLEKIERLEYLDTSEVTSMASMFCNCYALTGLDLGSFDTSKVTDMSCMFWGCSGLTALNVGSFDTSGVTDMSSMFSDCCRLENLDVGNFNTSAVTDMSNMFSFCNKLTCLDIGSFDTSHVTNMSDMFSGCVVLSSLYVGAGWSTETVIRSDKMFRDCKKLKGEKGTAYDAGKTDKEYARIDGGAANPGYLSRPVYTITVDNSTGGTVTSDKSSAAAGDTVTLTVTLDSGYVLKSLSYHDGTENHEISISAMTFAMPGSNITVTAGFEKKADPKPDPTPNPTPVRDRDDNDNTPLFTGTWNNAVKGGIWSQDSNGIWHYTSTEKFKNTWGYIRNPYAGEGQNTADWFRFDKHGNMLTGWQFIDGKWYYLNPRNDGTLGACLIGPAITPDGYEVDASGAWTGR